MASFISRCGRVYNLPFRWNKILEIEENDSQPDLFLCKLQFGLMRPPPSLSQTITIYQSVKPRRLRKTMDLGWRQFLAVRKALLKQLVPVVYGVPLRKRAKRFGGDITKHPERILLLNGAHIGDLIIATSLLPILRSAFPAAQIGFATGSWAQMVVRNHPDIAYTHCIDHWRANRSGKSFLGKMRQYRETRRQALQEIRNVNYDVALCLYNHFPDFLDLCWEAAIPVRVAFRNSFFSYLASHLVDEPTNPFLHQGERMAQILRVMPIEQTHFLLRKSTIPPVHASASQEVCHLLQTPDLASAKYRIIHIGTGEPRREFPDHFWRELAEKLSPANTLLFTGRGPREAETIRRIIQGLPNCVNACDRLSWDGYVSAVKHAELLYGVESMAGHLAGAVGTRCIVVYGGAAGVARWRPEGRDSIVYTNHVPCAPCYLPAGCPEMTCMQGFGPNDLVSLTELDH
ncbi:MAG: glycosyltransferase family 9 protein [Acidobacteriaceae bacterium]